ncbi:MAG: membrane protein [Methylibium sp. NZG]|nr:MAG: membrane protein [Methylibium sp. NZG]
MKQLLDAFWRAAAYCLHPQVIALSVLPLLITGGLSAGLGYFFWEQALVQVRATLEGWAVLTAVMQWLDSVGGGGFKNVLAPLVVVALSIPVIVVVSLLLVAMLMTPAIVNLVSVRRFPQLDRRGGAGFLQSAFWSLGFTVLALLAMIVSIPFWFVPPLILLLPPLIWGWLTYRVLSFDVLAEHASPHERRQVMREHRWPLLAMGVIAGYLGAAPSLLWAVSATMLVFAPLLIVAAVWIYTLVFAFSALWFAHYLLAALQALRAARVPVAEPVLAPAFEVLPPLAPSSHKLPALPPT